MSGVRLEISQKQGLVMSPMMQQAVQMLVMSTLELNQHIEAELETNPTLELTEQGDDAPSEGEGESPEAPAESSESSESPESAETELNASDESAYDEIDYENLFSSGHEGTGTGISSGSDSVSTVLEETATEAKLLPEFLQDQLAMSAASDEVKEVAEQVISKLDHDGFLGQSASDFAKSADVDELLARQAVDLVQTFDPVGVGAMNIRESLLVQLERRGERGSYAHQIIERYFNDLAQNRIPAITKALNTTLENVKDALLIIKGLEPHPGSSHGQPETNYVIPDVIVEKIDGEYVITLRNDRLPSVRVSRRYIRMFNEEKRKKRRSEVRKYLKEKLDAAFLLLKSIEKRQSTLYRVTESIVKHQRDFFEYGLKYMKPMTLKDVAEDIEVHESTVSRVTTQKYVECCRGVIELKYFFTSSIGTTSGEDASARSVKLVIKEIVAAEDTAKPLSDQKISDMLKTRGFTIARRTVSKYREQLRILPGKQRMKY